MFDNCASNRNQNGHLQLKHVVKHIRHVLVVGPVALALEAFLNLLRAGAHAREHYVRVAEVGAVAHRTLRHAVVRVVDRPRVGRTERLVRLGAVAFEPRLEAHPRRETHAHFELQRQVGDVDQFAFVLVGHREALAKSDHWLAQTAKTGTAHEGGVSWKTASSN